MPRSYKSLLQMLWLAAAITAAMPLHAEPPRDFDHSRFDRLLSQAVTNGLVDYARFRNSANFAAYLTSLEKASVAGLSTDEQLAFWINAYNALAIRNVLDNPGLKKPIDVKGFFDGKKFKVAGRLLTLNDIENGILREQFREPLIHFGLVCAARSCPPLLPAAYRGSTVRSQLARNASSYLASPNNRYDSRAGTLALSKIFDWYKGDFGGDAGLRTFVKAHGTQQMKQALAASPNLKITFMEYDWTLNTR